MLGFMVRIPNSAQCLADTFIGAISMPKKAVSFNEFKPEIHSSGKVVGITDRVYEIKGESVTFDDVLVKGDLSGELDYNGVKLRIVRVDTIIGLEVGMQGARGPVWKGVVCEIVK
jgi:hypothetical protein